VKYPLEVHGSADCHFPVIPTFSTPLSRNSELQVRDLSMIQTGGASACAPGIEDAKHMNEDAGWRNGYDNSCKILSFLVLLILSALSHFWLIFIAICIGIIAWNAIALLARLLFSMFARTRTLLGRQHFAMPVPEALAASIADPAESGNSR
jgi:hypothetical protein